MANKLVIGCGYLGERVAKHWLEQGHHVWATTRREQRAQELLQLGITPILCDVTQVEAFPELPSLETVVHSVGLDRSSGKSMREVYVEGLRVLLKSVPTPQRFVYVSSTSVYGQTDGGIVDETSPTEPEETSGQIVLEAEQVLREVLPASIILRFAGIYGPGRILREPSIRAGEALSGDPNKWLNLIYVEDGARAVLHAENQGEAGAVYNVCDGHPTTRHDFFSEIANLLDAPPVQFDESEATPRATNRRIFGRRLQEELGFVPQYPNFRVGLGVSVEK